MSKYRNGLPQLSGDLFLTDGGLETTLVFHEGVDLPGFAAFYLLKDGEGRATLRRYFRTYADIAKRFDTGLILESATWRASSDWGKKLGYSDQELAAVNREAVQMLAEIREESEQAPIVISGCIGPRGDGYIADNAMTAEAAEAYHGRQIETFAATAADMVSAMTVNHAEEAVGMAKAAKRAGMPIMISFTVETDGVLPTGQPLKDAIEQVDAATAAYPSYYMLNCAHPDHLETALLEDDAVFARIRGLRANASRKSHAELNESTELDIGNPEELGSDYARLRQRRLRQLNVLGGCCGTDHRHVEQIAQACRPLFHGAAYATN